MLDEPHEEALLAVVPEDGSTISNPAAQDRLGWSDESYWHVRDVLVDKGLLVRGRGRGGTLRRVVEAPVEEYPGSAQEGQSEATPSKEEVEIRREAGLYEPMASVIRDDWARDRRANPFAVEITAMQGRRATGGTWSRPDIVSVEIKTYEYVPGKYVEVVTFEVKAEDAIDVQAVYESLAHRRSSTHAYVVFHVPLDSAATLQSAIEDIATVARSHGIGVIVAGDPADYSTWEEREEAQRVDPDPDRLNSFIATQLSDDTRRKLARGLR